MHADTVEMLEGQPDEAMGRSTHAGPVQATKERSDAGAREVQQRSGPGRWDKTARWRGVRTLGADLPSGEWRESLSIPH